MKLTVQPVGSNTLSVYEIGEGCEYKTWYWGQQPTLTGSSAVNLIIKRWCHSGCRVEIPRERIASIKVDTNAHTEDGNVA